MSQDMDREFADRFLQGLERAQGVPAMHHGRLTWLARQIEAKHGVRVAAETTRKWSKGIIKPREKNMRILADIFGVDMMWLQTGEGPTSTKAEKKLSGRRASGAVHYVAGAMMMNGKNVAFPRDDDAIAQEMMIDLYAIKQGEQLTISVAELKDQGGGVLVSHLPHPLRASHIVLVHVSEAENRLYALDANAIDDAAEVVNGHLELLAEQSRSGDLIINDLKISNTPTLAGF